MRGAKVGHFQRSRESMRGSRVIEGAGDLQCATLDRIHDVQATQQIAGVRRLQRKFADRPPPAFRPGLMRTENGWPVPPSGQWRIARRIWPSSSALTARPLTTGHARGSHDRTGREPTMPVPAAEAWTDLVSASRRSASRTRPGPDRRDRRRSAPSVPAGPNPGDRYGPIPRGPASPYPASPSNAVTTPRTWSPGTVDRHAVDAHELVVRQKSLAPRPWRPRPRLAPAQRRDRQSRAWVKIGVRRQTASPSRYSLSTRFAPNSPVSISPVSSPASASARAVGRPVTVNFCTT